ncbi:hypothetical protein N1028_01250 [Herbiconiux sp. CPCC 203407]|uniref:LPXTG cell wall anchor domain-containing protein n=1 Tax=Herbiconiux oxytropis TaxID=2970915 RepID=A0AA41XE39_9MICO|nr:hypothetical protein [Herbiconiux oxytropis]MCS5721437.1 hypothetical protein [Herbiconiux oxytropis]MCS5724514.1 hypothetical protein [Herbiconiux oxytropis]
MRWAVLVLGGAAVLTALATLGPGPDLASAAPAPASAPAPAPAPGTVEVSLDGETWAPALELDPFPPGFVFAPGASIEVALQLRAPQAARLQVDVVDSGDGELWQALEVSTTITPPAPARGEIAELLVRVTLPATADGSTQRLIAHPRIVVTASADGQQRAAPLAGTGAPTHPTRTIVAVGALLLIIAGISICHNRGSAPPPSKEEPRG